MQCLHPVLIRYTPVDRDTGEMGSTRPLYVPCRKCIACKSNRRSEWSFRLLHESLNSEFSNYFITLTYSPGNLPCKEFAEGYQPCFRKRDYQLFFKRLRKHYEGRCKLRFFLSTEYGERTLRPHAHAVIFNVPDDLFTFRKVLESTWKLGRIQADCLNMQRMGYVSKYIMKQHFLDDLSSKDPRSPFMMCSQGIGRCYAEIYGDSHRGPNGLLPFSFGFDSIRFALPRYLKNKIFSEEERQELSLQSERWRQANPLKVHSSFLIDNQLERHFEAVIKFRSKL